MIHCWLFLHDLMVESYVIVSGFKFHYCIFHSELTAAIRQNISFPGASLLRMGDFCASRFARLKICLRASRCFVLRALGLSHHGNLLCVRDVGGLRPLDDDMACEIVDIGHRFGSTHFSAGTMATPETQKRARAQKCARPRALNFLNFNCKRKPTRSILKLKLWVLVLRLGLVCWQRIVL